MVKHPQPVELRSNPVVLPMKTEQPGTTKIQSQLQHTTTVVNVDYTMTIELTNDKTISIDEGSAESGNDCDEFPCNSTSTETVSEPPESSSTTVTSEATVTASDLHTREQFSVCLKSEKVLSPAELSLLQLESIYKQLHWGVFFRSLLRS